MDEDRIGLVLVRVAELRGKVTNCIKKTVTNGKREEGESINKDFKTGLEAQEQGGEGGGGDDDDEEAESLLNIREALESLEAQLSSLQVPSSIFY